MPVIPLPPVPLVVSGVRYEVRIVPSAKHPLQVFLGKKLIAEALLTSFHPWKLEVTEVNGHGRQDIAIGVTKPTHNLKWPHRTLFIFRFDGHELSRKWTGSTMGRPLVDFSFGPPDSRHRCPLATLESTLDDDVELSRNEWAGFGFRKVGSEHSVPGAAHLNSDGRRLIIASARGRTTLAWADLK